MVEAVRAGTIFAHDAKAHRRWQSATPSAQPKGRGLTGQALEQAVMLLARTAPEYVVVGR